MHTHFKTALVLFTLSAIRVTDATVLQIDRDRPTDGVTLLADDPHQSYRPALVEMVALEPFCASIVAATPTTPAQAIWRECVGPGRLVRTDGEMRTSALPGGQGRTLSLVVSSPVAGTSRLLVVVRFAIDSTPLPLPTPPADGGTP